MVGVGLALEQEREDLRSDLAPVKLLVVEQDLEDDQGLVEGLLLVADLPSFVEVDQLIAHFNI